VCENPSPAPLRANSVLDHDVAAGARAAAEDAVLVVVEVAPPHSQAGALRRIPRHSGPDLAPENSRFSDVVRCRPRPTSFPLRILAVALKCGRAPTPTQGTGGAEGHTAIAAPRSRSPRRLDPIAVLRQARPRLAVFTARVGPTAIVCRPRAWGSPGAGDPRNREREQHRRRAPVHPCIRPAFWNAWSWDRRPRGRSPAFPPLTGEGHAPRMNGERGDGVNEIVIRPRRRDSRIPRMTSPRHLDGYSARMSAVRTVVGTERIDPRPPGEELAPIARRRASR